MMRFLTVLMLSALAFVGGAAAQDAKTYPLEKLSIEGNEHFRAEDIAALTGLKIGAQVTEADFLAALTRLEEFGVFRELSYRFEGMNAGYHVTFIVKEMEEFYPIRLEGFDKTEEEMAAYLRERVPLFGPEMAFAEPYKDRIGRELSAYWREQGHKEPVIGHMRPVADDQYEVVFQPETTVETIAFTKFENTGAVRVYDAQRRFLSSARGIPYSERRLLELLRFNAAPLWEEKGYLDVSFCPCTSAPDPDSAGLLITIPVDQGPQYTFGAFTWPELAGVEMAEVKARWKPDTGDVANLSLIADSFLDINKHLRTKGFLDSFAAYEKKLNKDELTADIDIQIDQGPQYAFEGLVIRGLDIVGEPAVRRRWGMKRGEPFDASYPDLFLQRIEEEQMFENLKGTKSEVKLDRERRLATVELIFE